MPVGKKDLAVKRWLANKRRFADLCNAALFEGEQIIQPKDLEEADSESDVIITDKNGKEKAIQRFRDIVMKWKQEVELVILASENQDKVHYAMPVRNMVYDGLTYAGQIEDLWKEQRKNREKVSAEEFLSHMKKDDKLVPVITIVFYYGEKEWDGGLCLHDMLKKSDNALVGQMMKKYIPNYHINLVDAARPKELQAFQTDLQLILGMLQYRNQKEALLDYVSCHKEYFSSLDSDTYRAVQVFMDSEIKLKQLTTAGSEEEGVNMCKALDDLYKEGIEKGIEKALDTLVFKKYEKGMPLEKIAEVVEMPVGKVKDIIEKREKTLCGAAENQMD